MFETFLISHLALGIGALVLLWIHIGIGLNLSTICVALASGIWLLQRLCWVFFMTFWNGGSRSNTMKVVSVSGDTPVTQAVQLWIKLRRPWKIYPGQYVYVTAPHQGALGLLQAHPYVIAWVEDSIKPRERRIVLLVETRRGFSKDIRYGQVEGESVLLDGPYGRSGKIDGYDKVLFLAQGVGIAAHLLYVRHLLEAHKRKTARVRRISLVWTIESSGKWRRS